MAMLTATPASLLAASKRARDPSERFLWLELQGGRFLSLDTSNQDQAYLLATSKLPDRKYSMRGGRVLVVRGGRVVPQGDLGR